MLKTLSNRVYFLAILLSICSSCSSDEQNTNLTTLESGLQYEILQKAEDPSSKRPRQGDTVTVHYTGWLQSTNKKFDSSIDREHPFSFQIGMGKVIKGWEEGLRLMRIGEKRKFIIPPHLGYGPFGVRGTIPANATLIFEIELLSITQ